MDYDANLAPDGDGMLVTFPSVPEAITGGATEAEALDNAVEALEVALLTYAADGRPLPPPTLQGQPGNRRVGISAAVAAKIAFISAFQESGLTRVALGKRLGKSESEIRRMLAPYHATKLGAIEGGLRALGKRLVISVEQAA